MTTPRTHVIVSPVVSVVVSMIVTNVLAACGGGRASLASDDPAAAVANAVSPAIAFDNDAREHVQVYIVSEQRQWYLGRVEAGARRTFRVPDDVVLSSPQRLQLAVMVGQPITPHITGDPRAMFTISQPAARLFSQDWSIAQGQLVSAPIRRARFAVDP